MGIVTMTISGIPDMAIAWLWMKFTGGGLQAFGTALLVIYGIELFLSIKRVLAGSIVSPLREARNHQARAPVLESQ